MILVNYYECTSCLGSDRFQVVVNYVTHNDLSSDTPHDSSVLLTLNNDEFSTFIADSLKPLIDLTGSTEMPTMCKQKYFPTDYYDPEVYR